MATRHKVSDLSRANRSADTAEESPIPVTPTVLDDPPPLTLEDAVQLTDFSRACKAAGRAVVLYPAAHPAITASLNRLVYLTSPTRQPKAMVITVLPDGLLLDRRAPVRPEAALGELAATLHGHLIGQLTVRPGGGVEDWRRFLLLLGRSPDEVRSEGGFALAWSATGSQHVEVSELDYGLVLREGAPAEGGAWTDIVTRCLGRHGESLDATGRRALFEATRDPIALRRLIKALDAQAVADGCDEHSRATAVVSLLDEIVTAVTEHDASHIDRAIVTVADALSEISPDLMAALLSQPPDASDTPGLVDTIVSRMSDETIAHFVAQHALVGGTPMDRLAQAFHVLVPEDRRERVLSLARTEASSSPGLDQSGFEQLWGGIAQKLLTSYSDKPFVSDQYGRELSRARTTAIDVERVGDDPPERLEAWLSTLAAGELRRLDHLLMLDLLRLEQDPERWATLMHPATALVNDQLLIGDFECAAQVVEVLVRERAGSIHHVAAARALEQLTSGPLVRHVAEHVAVLDEPQFEALSRWLVGIGDRLAKALADRLTDDLATLTRERLTTLIVAFGPAGRAEAERLRHSTSAAARRAAVQMLQQFGGHEALAELTALLLDGDRLVVRDTVGAIMDLRTERASSVLSHALTHGSPAVRQVILATAAARDGRAVPIFSHVLRTVDHRGPLLDIVLKAIDALGAIGDPAGLEPLAQALRRGEWWAPRRTSTLRRAAAAALARLGTPDGIRELERAAQEGPRGVRAAARAALASVSARHEERR